MTIKAIIVDDELQSREILSTLLQKYCPDVQVIQACDSVEDAFDAIQIHKPDLVFLDIEMHSETGFDLLKRFDTTTPFHVIFVTAYENYALQAIKFSAIDYLLKPVDVEDLKEAVAKVVEKRKTQNTATPVQVEQLLQNLLSMRPQQKMALSTHEGVVFTNISDILYCEADGSYTSFLLKNGDKIMMSKNLKDYEPLLQDHNFVRIHKSYLVNIKEVVKYVKGDNAMVIMSNGQQLPVAKSKKDILMLNITGQL